MITLKEVEDQLKSIGVSFRFWGRAEVLELAQIIMPGETIRACMNGRYEGGFAMLCATDQRLLLVDKKPFHLSVEDIRYDMIMEVDFATQVLSSSLRICSPNKALRFMSYKPKVLRAMASLIQQRVMEIRQGFSYQTANSQPVPQFGRNQMSPAHRDAVGRLMGQQVAQGHTRVHMLPTFRNPYAQTPLMMRRQVGKFGPLPNTTMY